jgi:UDP-N-acetyl-D-galactosamine dehydrogenase
VAAVSHHQFIGLPVADFQQKLIKGGCLIDVKACFDAKAFKDVGIKVWRL